MAALLTAASLAAAPSSRGEPGSASISTGDAQAAGSVTGGGGMSGGGALAPADPTVRDVICQRGCVGLRRPTVGGIVQVSGRNLDTVTKMTFPGADKRIAAKIVAATDTTASAVVPDGAADGKVRVRDDFGNASGLSPTELDIRPVEELGSAGELTLAEAQTSPRKAFFFGVRAPRLDYVIGSSQPLNDLRIDVVNGSGEIVRSFFRDDVEANTSQSIRWNGKTSAGKAARGGTYRFALRSQQGARAVRARAAAGGLSFKLYGYIFPVRGPHEYGDGIGAPRAGHTHQGQDVFAACGTRMVAARGGRVQYNGYHSAAGNYIVIDGRNTGVDFAYMHLASPSPHGTGQVVRTGERIGEVGETGNASGCHLHYEMWAAPGWYEGGSFMDPAPPLRKWDRYS
jgi:murein DD-endopeptidase MepM/ murein hydrolase activator NlpD